MPADGQCDRNVQQVKTGLIKFVQGDSCMYDSFNMVHHNGINLTKIHGIVFLLSTDHSQRLTEQLRTKTMTFGDPQRLLSDALFDVFKHVTILRRQWRLYGCISPMKQQYVVTHTIRQTDSRITRQLGYKHTFFHNVVSTIKLLVLMFPKNVTCLSAGIQGVYKRMVRF